MIDRLKTLLKKLIEIFLGLLLGGLVGFGIYLYFSPPIDQMVHESPGLCGVVFVSIFVGGCAVSSIIYWVITGRNFEDVLFEW
jgi:hypothetical protein